MSTSTRSGAAQQGRPFRVLCVCEGNICRSPVAEVLLREALAPTVETASAGTRAVVGSPVDPVMQALLEGRGLDADGFRARQLVRAHVRDADLVVTMTARQRARAVELAPAAVRRTFTLRELARLLEDVDPVVWPTDDATDDARARWDAALPAAVARRRFVHDPVKDDIADPYGRDGRAYRRAFDEVADAVDRITAVLATAR